MTTITPRQLHDRLEQGNPPLLKVRTPAEYAEIHVSDVYLAPLNRLDATKLASTNGFARDQPIYILCRSDNRSKHKAEKLEKWGYGQCPVVDGCAVAGAEAGLPVVVDTSKVISLEPQMCVAAEAGALLAQFVDPAFVWLSRFIGAGLLFAGGFAIAHHRRRDRAVY